MAVIKPRDEDYRINSETLADIMNASANSLEHSTETVVMKMALKNMIKYNLRTYTVSDICTEYASHYNMTKDALANAVKATGAKKPSFKKLTEVQPYAIAVLMCRKYVVRTINLRKDGYTSPEKCLLGIFDEEDGLYHTDEDYIKARLMYFRADLTKIWDETLKMMKYVAPMVRRSQYDEAKCEWIPCENVLYDFKLKETHDYSVEHVFLYKLSAPYDPNATSPIFNMTTNEIDSSATPDMVDLQNYWEYDKWRLDLMDNVEEDAYALDCSIARAFRPATGIEMINYWSRSGASGKGVILKTLQKLFGNDVIIDKSVEDMSSGKIGELAGLERSAAIMYGENATDKYIDNVALLKAIITHDTVSVRDLYKSYVSVDPCVSVVQCWNKEPRVSDRTGSWYRRLWMIEFKRNFDGCARREIDDIYTKHPATLKYILKKALELPFFNYLPETENTKACLNRIKDVNDSWAHSFISEVMDNIWFNGYPRACLYVIYRQWVLRTKPQNRPLSDTAFYRELGDALKDDKDSKWYYDPKKDFGDKSAIMKDLADATVPTLHIICDYSINEFKISERDGVQIYGCNLIRVNGIIKKRYTGGYFRKSEINFWNDYKNLRKDYEEAMKDKK